MRSARALIAPLSFLPVATALAQPVVYVNASSPLGGDGTSWDRAYRELAPAIAAAPIPSEIWVATGRYTGTFSLRASMALYGGFAGTERTREERDPSRRVTTLSGGNMGTVVVIDTVAGVRVDGFQIIDGSGSQNGYSPAGGIRIYSSTATIANCSIASNTTTAYIEGFSPVGSSSGGGAMLHASTGTFENCVFSMNSASELRIGGCAGGTPYEYYPPGDGGAIAAFNSILVIRGCRFTDNFTRRGLGVRGCQFGFAGGGPGGAGGAIWSSSTTLTIDRCIFARNRTGNGGPGGAIPGRDVLPGGPGGPAGAIWVTGNPPILITNSIFVANRTGDGAPGGIGFAEQPGGSGGAIFSHLIANLRIINCTFLGNSTGGIRGVGGALAGTGFGSLSQTIANSIFWGNVDAAGSTTPASQIGPIPSSTIRFCVLPGGDMPRFGIRTIAREPALIDPDGPDNILGTLDDDYRPSLNSPCVDAGENRVYTYAPSDFGENARRMDDPNVPNTDDGTVPNIDVGAIERVGCVADVDNAASTGHSDGAVTIEDLLYYLFIFERGAARADIDDGSGGNQADGGVTIDDLLFYLTRYAAWC